MNLKFESIATKVCIQDCRQWQAVSASPTLAGLVFEKSGNLPTRGLGIETIILLSFLASILKSLTDLQKIQIPHDWFRDFRAEKLLQLADPATEFKLKSKIEPLLVI